MTTDDDKRRQELWTEFSKTRGGGKPPPPKPAPAIEPQKPKKQTRPRDS
jgi:hypothetical protein